MLAPHKRSAQALSVALRKDPTNAFAYLQRMDVVAATRRANLILLLQEVGEGRGDAAQLSRLTGVKAPTISQLRRPTFYKNGVERTMGDDIARKLEKGMGKPLGWMDHPHVATADADEAGLLSVYRLLTPEQRDHLGKLADMLARANRPKADGDLPLPSDPTRKRPH